MRWPSSQRFATQFTAMTTARPYVMSFSRGGRNASLPAAAARRSFPTHRIARDARLNSRSGASRLSEASRRAASRAADLDDRPRHAFVLVKVNTEFEWRHGNDSHFDAHA